VDVAYIPTGISGIRDKYGYIASIAVAKSLLIKGAGRARRSRLGSFRRDHSATALTTIGQRG